MGAHEVVQKLEELRKKRLLYSKLSLLIVFMPIIIMFVTSMLGIDTSAPFLCMFIVVGGVIIISTKNGKITAEYKKLYKENFVVSLLNEVFDNVQYDYERGFEQRYVGDFGLTRLGNRFRSEDYLRASYKGINFEQSDVVIQYHTSGKNSHTTTYFRGRMFAFEFPYKSVSSVQVFSEKYPYRAGITGNNRAKPVSMESDLFNKEFDVYSVEAMDAFYVLTPQMMEKIQSIKQRYNHVAMNFKGNRLYMGIWTSRDSFDGDMSRAINYVEEREATLKDASVITGIIDALGMMKAESDDNNTFDKEKTNQDYVINREDEVAYFLQNHGYSEQDAKDISKNVGTGKFKLHIRRE